MEAHHIILSAIVTEKSEREKAKAGKYTFEVNPRASKIEVRKAVEKLFKVHVTQVRVMNLMGKKRRMGMFSGRKPDWKKAIVTLKKGETIEAMER